MRLFLIIWFCLLNLQASSAEKSLFEASETYNKAFNVGRSFLKSKKENGATECNQMESIKEGFCLEGFFYEKIKLQLERELSLGIRRAPPSPLISSEEKVKIAWSKSLGRLMAEFNQTFFTEKELTPKLFLHATQGEKYKKFYVDGWTFYKSGFASYHQTLTACQKNFFQKHVCLWSLGRASYYKKINLKKIKRIQKELIAGFLFAKAYFTETPLQQSHTAIKIALFQRKVLINFRDDKLKTCLLTNHPVECLSVNN